jgi:quinohemoprotein ethanol dehydrogenase
MRYTTEAEGTFHTGEPNAGQVGQFPPFTAPADRKDLEGQPVPRMEGRLKAWNPRTGKAAWVTPPLPFISSGTLSTAGGLVLQGSTDGNLSAYDARTGQLLKRIQTGTAIMGTPITYELDGVQYIALLAGAGGPQGVRFSPDVVATRYQNFERLLVFKLDGTTTPLPPAVTVPVRQPPPPPLQADAATLAQGAAQFAAHCQRCHVQGGLQGGVGEYPDLWNMAPQTLAAFDAIVRGGAYRFAGMANFSDVLSEQDAAAIKAFIVNDVLTARGPKQAPATQMAH